MPMRQSQLFTKTRKEAPKDEEAKNAKLLIQAGYIHKEMAGVYNMLPLGLRVLKKIENIIREEMDNIGGQEVELSSLQDNNLWEKTDRWNDQNVDIWFKTKLKNDTELGLGFTHEEPLTHLLKDHINSYKDLPKYIYQFQTKFRNETRAKSGIMRGREFLMKDLYSFSKTDEEHSDFYKKARDAYLKIFQRVGLGDVTFMTFASGGSFSQFSHEFQTITDAGEDTIYLSREKKIAVNKEVYNDDVLNQLGLDKSSLEEVTAVEVGNIFNLGTKFSDALELKFKNESGDLQSVIMGSYGIGLGRLMGTVVEVMSDEKGIVWPKNIAPFDIHILVLNQDDEDVSKYAFDLYEKLQKEGKEVLIDDRDKGAGEKFADSDLIGIPTRIVISRKAVDSSLFEIVDRQSQKVTQVNESDILAELMR